MPATAPQRQPGAACAWFADPAGRALLDVAGQRLALALEARPQTARLWCVPADGLARERCGARGLVLHPVAAGGFSGSLRCRVPLPMASESFGDVAVLFPETLGHEARGLFEECARVLLPGGRLWLCALNPFSPYRQRWRGTGLHAHPVSRWRARLRAAGLNDADGGHALRFGPGWRVGPGRDGARLGAVRMLVMEKRVAALISPARVEPARWPAPLPAGLAPLFREKGK